MKHTLYTALIFICSILFTSNSLADNHKILNVSYDPTREFFDEYNKIFKDYWHKNKNEEITIRQSHGGSGKQARSVIDGLEADVVTLALAYDIDQIASKTNLLSKDWQSKLPDNSSPYTSTIVFLVRHGNPLKISDWDDLIRPNVKVITANPKTSGGARWNYLAAYGYALKKNYDNQSEAIEFMKKLYKNVPVLDAGARGSTTTFAQRLLGDVLITWENEAYLAMNEFGEDKFEVITPSISILAEPTVALVEKNALKHGTTEVSLAYLNYLYSDAAQRLAAKHYYRPSNESIAKEYSNVFTNLKLFTISQICGSWAEAQKFHFADNGLFDQFYTNN